LPRTGQGPLVFQGTLLSDVEGRAWNDNIAFWHDLRLYRTIKGKYVATIAHRAAVVDGRIYYDASEIDDPDSVVWYLRQYDPTSHLNDILPRELPRDTINQLRSLTWALFQARVTRLLSAASLRDIENWQDVTF